MKVKRIDIGIKRLKDSLRDFADTWKSVESGKKVRKEEGIYFESIDDMRSVLTNNRLAILRAIRENKPKSVYELSKMLGRNLKNVNEDLKLLAEIGLVTLETTKKDRKRITPHVDYAKITLEIAV
ncbi:MAG: ArsR family transcriptional regulator [Deltaproteobacteria bacterium]|nr:ArsR family transcriptional regulator [Deltaproteobacteria bacterium]